MAAAAITLLGAFPQLHLWAVRGGEWNGSHAVLYGDEMIYSAYVNALVEGRPRRSDPFTGLDDSPGAPRQESHLSIQFVPAYALALPARALGISTPTAFIILGFFTAFASPLVVFWLLRCVTNDARVAAAGAVFVLCLGTLAGWQGMAPFLLGDDDLFFKLPFLRRYQPAAAFPLLFVFFTLSWRSLASGRGGGGALRDAVLAGLLLPVLIFSYVYLWTSAAAWLLCLALVWLATRPADWRRVARLGLFVGVPTALAFILYAALLSNRPETLDIRQTFEATRAPDLLRLPELIGAAVIAAVVYGARRGSVDRRDPAALLAVSFALLPFAVFNQQLVTGRSVQPYHYGLFVTNYVALAAVVLAASVLWRARGGGVVPAGVLRRVVVLSLLWGSVEMVPATLVNTRGVMFDEAVPVMRRLDELARQDGTLPGSPGTPRPLVLSTELELNTMLPSYAPQPVLYSLYNLDFPDLSPRENKERFYKALYYSGVGADLLHRALKGESGDQALDWLCQTAAFDHSRISPVLTRQYRPVTGEEIGDEVRRYVEYAEGFSAETAASQELSYFVAPTQGPSDFTNLDRWYERDSGERFGKYVLYRVRLRVAGRP